MHFRFLYTLTMYLAVPVILYRLIARGLRYKEYFGRWKERFGFFSAPGFRESIWVHAVSVGEVNAAVPLIEALMRRYADQPFVITTVTPTGSERVQKLFGGRVFHVYLPYDLPASVERYLDRVRPKLAVIMETEIWPNLFFECHARGIPIVVANARLSERSLRGYGPVRPLARAALQCASEVAAQSQADADRLLALGANPATLSIAGNVKFDMEVPPGLDAAGGDVRATWGATRPVWIAASTHEGEELPAIEAHTRVLKRFPDALLLLAPRHPERFRPVAQLCRQYGFRSAVRSEDMVAARDTECFVIDTLGELLLFYAASDVAFVAGSLEPIGGHNVLEPAALGKPVVVGPHTFNFAEITESLIADGAALRVGGAAELGDAVLRLFAEPARRAAMGTAALAAVERERGAVLRVLGIVERVVAGLPA
ncbi:MAG TPA: lipid IV(A) 3-deoxy-D-manno-octulosonic acid transferase [Candidatus Saccharimonadia bacterium]|nr:lipid IV(A) 3-deoxy-D-manno-octulosonic acid transferase [Candidatus Saccharimonadia bacterium]